MMKKQLLDLLHNDNHYTVDKCVLKYAKKLSLDTNSLILLIYFLNMNERSIFDYKKILNDLDFKEKELLESVTILKDKKLVSIQMQKNDSGMLEEIIDTSSFYEVLMSNLLDVKESKKDDNSLYDIFEKEFGRTLSPIEYEIIGSWVESGIPSELIIEALKEATYNGVNNLRYIDKILFEWNKKGIKKASDISRVEKKEEEEKEESYYEYDWLNE